MEYSSHKACNEKITGRIKEITLIADKFYSELLTDVGVYYYEDRIEKIVLAYFILNDQYSNWRMYQSHLTEDAKICGLMTMAIATFPPFLPSHNNVNALTEAQKLANPMFTVACCQALSSCDLKFDDQMYRNLWQRLFDVMLESNSVTLEGYRVDLKNNIVKNIVEYSEPDDEPNIKDKFQMDTLISIFELLIKISKYLKK